MKAFQSVLIACMAWLLLNSCTKVDGYLSPYNPNGSDSTGSKDGASGGNGPADSTYKGVVTNNYQPDTAGSQWTYSVNEVFNIANSTFAKDNPAAVALFAGLASDTTITYHVRAIGTPTVLDGLTYYSFTNDYYDGVFSPTYAVSGGTYTGADMVWEVQWLGGGSFGGFSLNNDTLVYLKEQPAGTTWTQTTIQPDGFGGSDTTSYTFTIKATGLTRTESKISYPDVVQVESTSLPSTFSSYAALFGRLGVDLNTTTEYYYARNVGLIEEDLSEPFMGVTLTAVLTSAAIK
jgi:hypothetical protein